MYVEKDTFPPTKDIAPTGEIDTDTGIDYDGWIPSECRWRFPRISSFCCCCFRCLFLIFLFSRSDGFRNFGFVVRPRLHVLKSRPMLLRTHSLWPTVSRHLLFCSFQAKTVGANPAGSAFVFAARSELVQWLHTSEQFFKPETAFSNMVFLSPSTEYHLSLLRHDLKWMPFIKYI